ncbi:ammonium transporter AmtB-like domain-containing protein [Desarmillaria tabescens]|uniref:Ammonium transporter AmtB-like domain-containing protein n=1 Tax=Armillaria tabescens TaxID=1929756 RepID=A0AA39JHN6_ARMTA|nr:ammonium transporter AmtB-like domain-containing protein [Desarmillaria tabescens]KAK0441489.1 ammonium transporter AmtB-like domain-containing protein [Desarmillaria tabescens]
MPSFPWTLDRCGGVRVWSGVRWDYPVGLETRIQIVFSGVDDYAKDLYRGTGQRTRHVSRDPHTVLVQRPSLNPNVRHGEQYEPLLVCWTPTPKVDRGNMDCTPIFRVHGSAVADGVREGVWDDVMGGGSVGMMVTLRRGRWGFFCGVERISGDEGKEGWGTERVMYRPHNTTYVVLGVVFLWFGWFGFNGGSALSANLRAAHACIVTNLAASSVIGFCSGAITGLVAITPACGFVGAPAAVLFGVLAGICCNFATQLKYTFRRTWEPLHRASFDGIAVIPGGWIDRNYVQLGYQLADSVTGEEEEEEVRGLDEWDMGELAYDYAGFERGCDTDGGSGSLGEKGVEKRILPILLTIIPNTRSQITFPNILGAIFSSPPISCIMSLLPGRCGAVEVAHLEFDLVKFVG